MYLDNFSGRSVINTYANQQQATHWSTYIDAFMALEHLSKDLEDANKKIEDLKETNKMMLEHP